MITHIGILQVLSSPDIRSTVPNGSLVFAGQPIRVTCTTTNSRILAWESEQYIGNNDQIAFAFGSTLETTIIVSRMGAIARLINSTDSNGVRMIQSEFLINVSSTYPNSTISCRNVDYDLVDNITFHKTGECSYVLLAYI